IWIKEGGNNLLEAFLLVNKLDQPSLNKDKVLETIARIQQEVWLEMNDKLTALEQVALLNHILFSIHEFKGVAPNDLKPEHFSLSTVLETKIASPVAIGVLYMHIAQSLKIPLFAVNLSSNFLLAYTENYIQTQKLLPSGKVLFYLNPNKAGVLFTDEEIDLFVLHHQLPKLPSNYVPISNYLVIFRLINDLISVHVHNDNAIMLKKLLELFAE
ncbi:MAG: transglutaminase family protein, partial [Bacteroidota bacterium]